MKIIVASDFICGNNQPHEKSHNKTTRYDGRLRGYGDHAASGLDVGGFCSDCTVDFRGSHFRCKNYYYFFKLPSFRSGSSGQS
jgi:hypothetical protein